MKVRGSFTIVEAYQDMFTKGDNDYSELPIKSGTIELNDNKMIILVD